MYLSYFGLQREPFHTTPDPSFLFLSPTHKEALGAIIYGIEKRKGFIAVIGEVGTGKTSILRAYLERKAPQKQKTIYIFNPVLSFHGLLTAIFRSLELTPRQDDVTEMVNQHHETLITEYQSGGTVVLAIDEAQNMPMETLENLRMLSNLETSTDKLIQIILLGQPELDSLLKQPSLRQFRQRIALWANICPLTEEESRAYIEHRIERASTTGSSMLFSQSSDPPVLFAKGALNLLARQGKGIPRRINILCDNALITGFGRQCKPVSVSVAKEIIQDFGANEESGTSMYVKWAVGLAVAIILFLGLIFFFGFPFSNGNIKKSSSVAMRAEKQGSNINTNQPGVPSIEVQQMRQRHNVKSSNEGILGREVVGETQMGSALLQDPSNAASGSPSFVDSTLRPKEESDISSKSGFSQINNKDTKTTTEETVGSGKAGIAKFRKSDNSLEGTSAASPKNITSQELGEEKLNALSTKEKFSSPFTRAVKYGESLSQIAIETYGSENGKYLEWVKQHNPHIANPDFILPGQSIVLPEYPKRSRDE